MESYRRKRGPDGRERVEVRLRGSQLLNHPMYNRSTAFTPESRRALGLEGMLPDVVSTMEQQARRAYANIIRKTDALERYIGLAALEDRNEHLFYRVLLDHLEEFLPIVYTPTVGLACREYSRIFRRARGLWITPEHRGRIDQILANAPYDDVRLIVVTDNERILGLGDQGAGGMGIPIGKAALYVAAAGIHPAQTLPVSLDVGTDNEVLLQDDLYVGYSQPRLRGAAYQALVDEFVHAVARRFPGALLQWEDFKQWNAVELLERYRGVLPSFNDDIQGTAAMAVAGTMVAAQVAGTSLTGQRIVIVGAGAAGTGIARLLRLSLERAGLGGDDLQRALALVDVDGLVVESDLAHHRGLAWPRSMAESAGLRPGHQLVDVVRSLRPTALVGVAGVPGLFTEPVVREMAAHAQRPIIFPLSNPTERAEAHPRDLLTWSDGRALIATGSPFGAVTHAGRTVKVGQGNNVFIFPGVGLGVLVSEARGVTDTLFLAAARALSAEVTAEEREAGSLFPAIARLRTVTARVAEAVVRQARDEGIGRDIDDGEIAGAVASAMWEPNYPELDPV